MPSDENLRALYHETCGEITRLRDLEWKITYYFVTLSGALTVFFLHERARPLLCSCVRVALTVMIGLSFLLGAFYLDWTHGYLTQQRNIRRNLEDVLGLHDPLPGRAAVLPAEWKRTTITAGFQRRELIVPFTITMALSHLLCLFVLWAVK